MIAEDEVVAALAADDIVAGLQIITGREITRSRGSVNGQRLYRLVEADRRVNIETVITIDMVGAIAAEDSVIAGTASQVVGKITAPDQVVTGTAVGHDPGVGIAGIDEIVTR